MNNGLPSYSAATGTMNHLTRRTINQASENHSHVHSSTEQQYRSVFGNPPDYRSPPVYKSTEDIQREIQDKKLRNYMIAAGIASLPTEIALCIQFAGAWPNEEIKRTAGAVALATGSISLALMFWGLYSTMRAERKSHTA